MYDEEVINILLNIGRVNLSPIFPIFSTFEATSAVSPYLCLAMAAYGALFSTAEGSYAVAKSLYNDARRLHLETIYQAQLPTFGTAMNCAKTFIILEMYGLCSGDKRSYEFQEVFHHDAMETFKSCWRTAPASLDEGDQKQLDLLTEAISVLTSYRVLLVLRPPSFLCVDNVPDNVIGGAQRRSLVHLKALMSPIGPASVDVGSLQDLANLCAYTWTSSPRGQECSPTHQLWKPECIELALARWMDSRVRSSDQPNLSQLLLYHLAHISLHSNLALLQRFAHDFVRPTPTAIESKGVKALRDWIGGSQFSITLWHAETTLRLIKENMPPAHRHRPATAVKARFIEPPHLSYCIYFATLVMWYGGIKQCSLPWSRNGCIDTAVQLLSRLKAPVSKVVSGALCELLSDEV